MNLLGAVLYDPAVAVTKGAAASVMAAFDTTNARIAFVVPPSGKVRVVIQCTIHGAITFSQILLGVLEGSTLRGRAVPVGSLNGTALATSMMTQSVDYIVSGLTPGASVSWDAAWGVETFVTASLIKYGGPNDTTANNGFGALIFQLYDPCPIYTPTSGTAPTSTVHVKLDAIDDFVDTEMAATLAAVDTEIGTIITNIAAVQADTDNIQTRLPAALVGGRMDASVGALGANAIDAAALKADAITKIQLGLPTQADVLGVAGAVWDVDVTLHFTADSAGEALLDTFNNVLAVKAALGTPVISVSADLAAIHAKTTNLPTDPADQSLIIDATTAIMSRLGAPAGASHAADVAAVKVDTAAVKVQTDKLVFTVANKLDVNILVVNGVTVIGIGTEANPWRGA